MREFVSKDPRSTIQAYAKTVSSTSKSLNVGWDNCWKTDYQIGDSQISGSEAKAILEERFMGAGLWQALNDRIQRWANDLETVVKRNNGDLLASLIQGPQIPRSVATTDFLVQHSMRVEPESTSTRTWRI